MTTRKLNIQTYFLSQMIDISDNIQEM